MLTSRFRSGLPLTRIVAEFSLTIQFSHPDFWPFHRTQWFGWNLCQGRTSHEVLGRRTTSRPSWPWWRMKRWLQRMRWGGLRRQRDDALWAIITFVLLQSFFPKTKTEMKPFRVGSADWRRTARNTYSRTGMEVSYWVEILEGTVDCGITWKIWRNPGY